MTRKHANVLRAFAVWTVFVWATRIKNVFDHGGAAFIAVHVALALVSIGFAAACWWIVTQNRGRNAPGQSSNGDDAKASRQ